jgi:hypothetical protein
MESEMSQKPLDASSSFFAETIDCAVAHQTILWVNEKVVDELRRLEMQTRNKTLIFK